jgi:hypothetical protein
MRDTYAVHYSKLGADDAAEDGKPEPETEIIEVKSTRPSPGHIVTEAGEQW